MHAYHGLCHSIFTAQLEAWEPSDGFETLPAKELKWSPNAIASTMKPVEFAFISIATNTASEPQLLVSFKF
jgi:hypothetical protein